MSTEIMNLRKLALRENATIALFTGDPTVPGTEVTGAGYARMPSGFTAPVTQNPMLLPSDVVFGPAGEDWGTVTHMALCDPVTGDVLDPGEMTRTDGGVEVPAPKEIGLGDELRLPAGTGFVVVES